MADPWSVLVSLVLLAPPSEASFQADSTRVIPCPDAALHAAGEHGLALKYPSRLELLRELAKEPDSDTKPCRDGSPGPAARQRAPDPSTERGERHG